MTSDRPTWDVHFLQVAALASEMSTCRKRHVGAVLVVDGNRQVGSGFNGNVPKAQHCTDGGCDRCLTSGRGKDLHLCVCVHAEQNAVAFCARYGIRVDGATLYCTTKPCLDCIKLAAVAGIARVVYREEYPVDYTTPPTIRMEWMPR